MFLTPDGWWPWLLDHVLSAIQHPLREFSGLTSTGQLAFTIPTIVGIVLRSSGHLGPLAFRLSTSALVLLGLVSMAGVRQLWLVDPQRDSGGVPLNGAWSWASQLGVPATALLLAALLGVGVVDLVRARARSKVLTATLTTGVIVILFDVWLALWKFVVD